MIRAPGVDETVKCGDLTLPGILQGIKVNGSLETQEDNLEDTSKKQVVVKGYTTQTVQLFLTLTGTPEEINRDIGVIQKVFQVDRVKAAKPTTSNKTPTVVGSGFAAAKLVPFRIVNPHLDARRIKVVLFDGFTTDEDDTDDSVRCTLSFHEFDADVAKLEAKIKAQQKNAGGNGAGPNGNPNDPNGNGGDKNKPKAQGSGQISNPLQAYVDGASAGLSGGTYNPMGEVTKLRGN
ncbi:hypothetical protein [Deinococcus misasensis]|uniref:hypothetical protein n=1 Tax=Deinococcus misasensis TaxID=392413 RepID=UPI00054FA790|nr:hypothetical protein [Deinococcus misasensis]